MKMTKNYISLVSMNCQGLSSAEKRSDTLNSLKVKATQSISSRIHTLQQKNKIIYAHNGAMNVILATFQAKQEAWQSFSITILNLRY